MYELDIPVNHKAKILQLDEFTYSCREDIIQWSIEQNIDIKYHLRSIHFVDQSLFMKDTPEEEDKKIKENNGYLSEFSKEFFYWFKSFTLVFNTKEDRNLFKLTWM